MHLQFPEKIKKTIGENTNKQPKEENQTQERNPKYRYHNVFTTRDCNNKNNQRNTNTKKIILKYRMHESQI